MIYRLLLAALCVVCFSVNAEARQKSTGLHPECNITMPCIAPYASTSDQVRVTRGRYVARQMGFGAPIEKSAVRVPQARHSLVAKNAITQVAVNKPEKSELWENPTIRQASIVAHPSGCPSRAFCGCGAAVRIFGSPIRSLWLAANWFKFPRAIPSAGMVAVRRHHVMVLEADLGGGVWQVFDANSGKHLTRIHARSIAGYAIVNPKAG